MNDELIFKAKILKRKQNELFEKIDLEQSVYNNELTTAICNMDSNHARFLMEEHEKNLFQFKGETEDLIKAFKEVQEKLNKEIES